MFNKTAQILAFVAAVTFIFPLHASAVTVGEIEAEIMCQCGCQKVTINCTCEEADNMRDQINALISQGKSRKNILDAFVSQYGESVLAAPPKEGFNMVAYGVPMTGFFLGSVVAVTMVRRWRSSRKDEEDDESGSVNDINEELEEMIRGELEELEDWDG